MHDWKLWEVFIRGRHGLAHKHVGSVLAADREMALAHARDVYTRRNEGASIWVAPSCAIAASAPEDRDMLFDSLEGKPYRLATHFPVPDGVEHL